MRFAALGELAVCWLVWWYPFIFRAPHRQKRESIARPGATSLGLLMETAAFAVAFFFRLPAGAEPGMARTLLSMALAPVAPILGWTAVTHLGRQFRITAGLYHDHELVHTGPYGVVRHPIYASLLAMLLSTLLLLTPLGCGAGGRGGVHRRDGDPGEDRRRAAGLAFRREVPRLSAPGSGVHTVAPLAAGRLYAILILCLAAPIPLPCSRFPPRAWAVRRT